MKTSQEKRPDHMSNDFGLPEPSPPKTSRISRPFYSIHLINKDKGISVHEGGEHGENLRGTQPLHPFNQLGKRGGGREQDNRKNSQTGLNDHIP